MKIASLVVLVRRDVGRTRGPLAVAGFGIAVGTAALVFFVALGLGARAVLLGDVFPIDQVELEPRRTEAGLLSLLGGPHEPAGVSEAALAALARAPGVATAYPKLRFRFPAKARGGREVIGREIGTHEMIGDGIAPALVEGDVPRGAFEDPLRGPSHACETERDCEPRDYCERPSGEARGQCSKPVPALISRYLVELFDHAIAPSHGLPPIASTLLRRAEGVPFEMTLGTSLLGVSKQGRERTAKIVIVGVSPKAIDIGITLPVDVVRRWNREYSGERAGTHHSSVILCLDSARDASHAIDVGATHGLVPHDTRARDVSVLISSVLGLLVLVASVVLLVAASNIAHTFRVLVGERRREIGLYRALGATPRDMRAWMLVLALIVGMGGGLVGAVVAFGAARLADWRAAVDLPEFPFKPDSFFVFPWWLWAGSLSFAATFAILGALRPASRAAKTDPAAALQHGG